MLHISYINIRQGLDNCMSLYTTKEGYILHKTVRKYLEYLKCVRILLEMRQSCLFHELFSTFYRLEPLPFWKR